MTTDPSPVQTFSNEEFEIEMEVRGDSFIVYAPGLARALGHRESYDLTKSIPDGEKGSGLVRTPGGDQQVWYLTEPGFYRAIGQRQAARIRNEAAREQVVRFQNWIYHEVLPSLRKRGYYGRAKSALELLRDQVDMAIDHERRLSQNEQRTTVLEAKVKAIEGNYDEFTALGYAKLNGHRTDRPYLMKVGKLASLITREVLGRDPHKRQDATFGEVNVYPVDVLREAFLWQAERDAS